MLLFVRCERCKVGQSERSEIPNCSIATELPLFQCLLFRFCFELVSLFLQHCVYGVVPKRLLTFLGSLYKEVAKTTSGTFVYRYERQTA